METITRTDCHAPSKINPDDYEFVAQECIKIEGLSDCEFIRQQRELIRAHMARTGGTYSHHAHGGNCHICGSVNAIYTVLFYHAPTNSYVRVGRDCAEKLDASCGGAINLFSKQCKSALEFKAGKAKAQTYLAAQNLAGCWEIYQFAMTPGNQWNRNQNQESIIADMIGKLVQYGSLSPKQIEFLGKLTTQIAERPAREAAQAAAHAMAADCPEGRITIIGTIVSTKVVDTDFGKTYKMLVVAESGYKVWGTIPGSLAAGRGDKIEFTATVEQSKDDAKFGFFKRPSKASVLEAAINQ